MALLVPGIGKEHQYLVERSSRDAIAQHIDGVAADDAQILRGGLLRAQQQPAYSRAVHLDSEVVDVRMGLRQDPDNFSGPEANFQAARRLSPENGRKIQRRLSQVDAVGRPEFAERALLRRRR